LFLPKVDGDESGVVAILFVTRDISHASAMSRVMNKYNITSLRVLANAFEGILNVSTCRRMGSSVVHQDKHFAFFETLLIDQILLDILQEQKFRDGDRKIMGC